MKSTSQATNISPIAASSTAKSLRNLYAIRATFSIIWVILVTLFARSSTGIATVLFIVYPAWDAVATVWDIKANPPSANRGPQYLNMAISITTTAAVIFELQKGIPQALIVFGIWAILTGLIQLLLGLRRRKQLGGQWPMILSGGQSMLAGGSFIFTADAPDAGINTLAGYAAFGAFYFLLAAFRLSKNNQHKS